MHLGFLTPEYPHAVSTTPAAGIGTSIKNLVSGLLAEGVDISIFIYGQKETKIFREKNVRFHFLKQQEFSILGWYLHRKSLEKYINKIVEFDKIDAVEVPEWTGITAFMKLLCPTIVRMHGSDTYFCHLENRPQKRKNYWLEKIALQNADHLLSVSQFTAEKTKQLFNLQRDIQVIPNSVDINHFRPNYRKPLKNRILYFGSIIRKKGVLELPSIFNRIIKEKPSAELVLAGRDVLDVRSGRSTLELMCDKFSKPALPKMSWIGNLPYASIFDEITKAEVIVLPSYAEAMPMALLESMAMGKALVTSDTGWAEEVMVDGETGFTVSPADSTKFAEKVILLLNDPQLSRTMGKSARKRVIENYSTEKVAMEAINFYKSII